MKAEIEFSDEIADEILRRLEDGETLVSICRDDHMPHRRTVYKWEADEARQPFGARFARARKIGYDVWFEECKDIAEDGSHDYRSKKRLNGDEYEEFDAEHVQRSRLRIDTRLKLLARVDPKKYGERQQVAPVTPDGDALPLPGIVFVPVEAKPREGDS